MILPPSLPMTNPSSGAHASPERRDIILPSVPTAALERARDKRSLLPRRSVALKPQDDLAAQTDGNTLPT
jgi:hypothetical protein